MRSRSAVRTLAISGLVLAGMAANLFAQTVDLEAVRASKRAVALRLADPIVVDGALDEAAWQLAEPASGFYQQTPDEGAPATERTEVRFLDNDDMLYVGAMMFDPQPDHLVINELRRDFNGFDNEVLTIIYVVWNENRLPAETRRAVMLKYTHLIAF